LSNRSISDTVLAEIAKHFGISDVCSADLDRALLALWQVLTQRHLYYWVKLFDTLKKDIKLKEINRLHWAKKSLESLRLASAITFINRTYRDAIVNHYHDKVELWRAGITKEETEIIPKSLEDLTEAERKHFRYLLLRTIKAIDLVEQFRYRF